MVQRKRIHCSTQGYIRNGSIRMRMPWPKSASVNGREGCERGTEIGRHLPRGSEGADLGFDRRHQTNDERTELCGNDGWIR